VLIFSRNNNFGDGLGVEISRNTIYIRTQENAKQNVRIPINSAVFASSDVVSDSKHFSVLESQFEVDKNKLVMVQTPEELFTLLKQANHVYTDRYHPGVASMRLKKNLTIIDYGTVLYIRL
jgi:hypothetical protein